MCGVNAQLGEQIGDNFRDRDDPPETGGLLGGTGVTAAELPNGRSFQEPSTG